MCDSKPHSMETALSVLISSVNVDVGDIQLI